ncbi:hypothetical protein [Georgenia subflava]|uniref:DUF4381 family protein n=1 Tax=Georgenia subflava TaxID=1622177 RepID=A0A6N7EQT8_9MICO|nr:hypothetical protein [Georgenia subflava]MPV38885.1 hypothetical protein [Georgenia subflava]
MPDADVLPPEAYTWWVPVLGLVLLLLVAAWYVFVHRWTDPARVARRRSRREAPGPMTPSMRQRYAAEVDQHFERYEREHDLRALHLELARTMREFASERIGTDVRAWTRGDIAGYDPTRRVGDLLSHWEEPSFAVRSDAEAAASAAHAKEVVAQW